jgi:NAD-dependent deacetylase
MLCLDAEPNITHTKLAELEQAGKLKGIVTQNIDGLHQKAGSKNVMELHGSVLRNYCERCYEFVSAEDILHSEGVPKCPKCGGPVKPDVVLYEEGLNMKTMQDAIYYISHADVLIVGGTSLAVYPAAGLIDYYGGHKLVLINKSATPMDRRADLLIQDGLGSVFSQIEV